MKLILCNGSRMCYSGVPILTEVMVVEGARE